MSPKSHRAKCAANEIGRLAQGMLGRVEGTNTFFFIDYEQIPQDRRKDITSSRISCNIKPEKVNEPNRTRITALEETRCTSLKRYEYVRMNLADFPENVIEHYKL
jgi:hypothetical protein